MSVKVMIVDNTHSRRQQVENAFRNAGFEVCSASDSLGCSLKLRSERPDLVILEAKLPVVSGPQILQSLRKSQQARAFSVIVLADESELESLCDTGSDARDLYLARPATPAALVAVATQLLADSEWRPPGPIDSPLQPTGTGWRLR